MLNINTAFRETEENEEQSTVPGWLAVVLLPAAALVYLLIRGRAGIGLIEVALFAGSYLLTGLGITAGYHRLVTHRSFSLPPSLRWITIALGSMALQGSVLGWASNHRQHHRYSDRAGDVHSPVFNRARRIPALLKGFVYAQIGWYLDNGEIRRNPAYIPDLLADPQMVQLDRLFPLFSILTFAIPAALGGLLRHSWLGALDGLFWGGVIRIVVVHHATGAVNSICHLLGSRPYPCRDNSRNNFLVALAALGEGWHNNHHAFPTSAYHGFKWWQIDVTGLVISLLATCGLASGIKRPPASARPSR